MTTAPLYPPAAHRETRFAELVGLIRQVGFGHLIVAGGGTVHATGVPFLTRVEGETLVLEAHLQRGNPQWPAIGEARAGEVLALFQGPHAYIHPGWYETKKRDGKAVPTWNYLTVQARGPAEIFEGDAEWLKGHVRALSETHEAGRSDPWSLDDAPEAYIAGLLRGIVGVRIAVRELDGRWKLSGNQPDANRLGVIEGLEASKDGGAAGVAAAMRRLVPPAVIGSPAP